MSVNVKLPAPLPIYDPANEAAARRIIEQTFLTLPASGEQGEAGEQGEPGGSDRLTQPDTTQLLMTDITDEYLLARDGTEIVGVDRSTVGSVLNLLGAYEATANGLVGDGGTDDSPALDTLANTTLTGVLGDTIVFKAGKTYFIGTDVTIPADVTLVFQRGANLEIDTGTVFTHLGEIVAGPYQIFSGDTRGVRFATSATAGNGIRPLTNAARPEWWGAIADDSTSCAVPCQRMIDAVCGYPFYSHTDNSIYTATSGTATTVTVTGAGWSPNQWQGATLIIDSGTGAAAVYLRIASNTADTITVDGYYTGSQNSWVYNAGDFTSVAGAPAAGSVIIISLAAAAARHARMPIEWGGGIYKCFDTSGLRRTNVTAMREYGKGIGVTNIRVSGGESGTATGGSTTTLVKSTATWTVNHWRKYWVVTLGGTGSNQFRRIKSNTATTLTLDNAWFVAPDATTLFAIIPEAVFDANGWFQGSLEHMTLSCETEAGLTRGTMFGVLYRRNDAESFRGSSNGTFRNVWINGHAFHSYWMIGGGIGGYQDSWQEDLPQFINVRADGLWNFSYTGLYYKFNYFFGSGQYGNNLNHLGEGIHASGCETVIGVDRTNLYLNGITSGPSRYGIYPQNGVANYIEVGAWRAETCARIYHAPLPTAACSVKFRSVSITDWAPIYDTTLGCTPVSYSTGPGGIEFDGFNLGGPVDQTPYRYNNQAAASGTTTTCTVAGTPWTVDMWKGFYFRIRSGTGKYQPPVLIASNTNNTLTFAALQVAPDSTSFIDIYAIPVFLQSNPGTNVMRRLSVAGLDPALSFWPITVGAQVRWEDLIELDPLIGGQVNRYHSGVNRVVPMVNSGTSTFLQAGDSWSKLQSKPDVFMGRIADGTLGISNLSTPILSVPAIGTTDTGLFDKIGSHTAGATTHNYKLVAKVPAPGGTYKRALASAAFSVTNALATLDDNNYVRIYPPYTPCDPAWVFDVLKDTGGGTYAVFVNGENLTVNEMYVFYDKGQATKAYTVPTVDETGVAEIGGYLDTNGFRVGTVSKTGAYTLTASDHSVYCDATGGAFTVTLPPAATAGAGRRYEATKTDASGNVVTVDADGAETISGVANILLPSQYDSVTVECTGSAWLVK